MTWVYRPAIEPYSPAIPLEFDPGFFRLLDRVVAIPAQALKFSFPELSFIATMRFDVICDGRCYRDSALQAEGTKRAARSPSVRRVPTRSR
jgi:hypothetical protein